MIRAAFFDIDGTLMAHSIGRIPEDTLYALDCLKKKGIRIFTSTGRHILELDELGISGLGFDGHVLLNGQLCLDKERRVLAEVPIGDKDIRQIFPVFEERRIPLSFVEKEKIYINYINEQVRKAQRDVSSALPETGNWEGAPVYLIVAFAAEDTVAELMKHMPHCRTTRWNSYGVDIIAEGGGKEKGIEKMLSHFSIGREEVIAFGDGENDMEMLEYAGIGVAMGNADEKVKACADYVTEDADEGGILSALRHFEVL